MTTESLTETELELIRDYPVSVDRLWRAVTEPSEIVQWFGPEGVDLVECKMDLTRRGPWVCIMVGKESGDRFKNTGQVTHVRPPKDGAEGSAGLTWAWHDDQDRRGHESHVIFEVSAHEGRARLRIVHRDLPDTEVAQSHSKGWLSTLRRLDAYLAE